MGIVERLNIEPFPEIVWIEGIPVTAFPNSESLFERISQETLSPGKSRIAYLNIHVANTAFLNSRLKGILQNSEVVYCDGAGIVVGARLEKAFLPVRLTAADWFIPMLDYFSEKGHRVYLLGGAPGVPGAAMATIRQHLREHSVVGAHHGYILDKPDLERRVIEEINALRPDILIIGFGTPLQELWVEQNQDRLDVSTIYCIGAVMDFISGKVRRCPAWMGKIGLEWLYRFYTDPKRLMMRYVIGNPWFLSRIALGRLLSRFASR